MKKLVRVFIVLMVIAAIGGVYLWFGVINKKIELNGKPLVIYVRTGEGYEQLIQQIEESKAVENMWLFKKLAEFRNLPANVYEGRYTINEEMGYNDLIVYFRTGKIDEVAVDFHSIRTKDELAERVSKQIEASKDSLLDLLNDDQYMSKFGLNSENALVLFLPNTYKMFWNTGADKFIKRMAKEYKKFWTAERKEKAKKQGLSQSEVSVLASIVMAEQSKRTEEWPIIAGLYLNRLRTGMPLQSDPTAVYASGDFTIKRVTHDILAINSPYNTYKNTGLPPGPIYLPAQGAIDAVLNAQKHNYFYMCASGDGSFKHNFASTLKEHNQNAQLYWRQLDKQNIH
jgi:UPF0755 protein